MASSRQKIMIAWIRVVVIMAEMENKGTSSSDIQKEILAGFVKARNKG